MNQTVKQLKFDIYGMLLGVTTASTNQLFIYSSTNYQLICTVDSPSNSAEIIDFGFCPNTDFIAVLKQIDKDVWFYLYDIGKVLTKFDEA